MRCRWNRSNGVRNLSQCWHGDVRRILSHPLIGLSHFFSQKCPALITAHKLFSHQFSAIGARDFIGATAHHLAVCFQFRQIHRLIRVQHVVTTRTLRRVAQQQRLALWAGDDGNAHNWVSFAARLRSRPNQKCRDEGRWPDNLRLARNFGW